MLWCANSICLSPQYRVTRLSGFISHRLLCCVHFAQDEEHAYIVQELCDGGDLKSLLEEKGCISEVETAIIMRGVLDVLVECHKLHICYGDMKVSFVDTFPYTTTSRSTNLCEHSAV